MDEQLTYQLLKIMKHNGNVWELISGGYEFGQVAFFGHAETGALHCLG